MFFYSKISCRVIGKVLYISTFKGRENGPLSNQDDKISTTEYFLFEDLLWRQRAVAPLRRPLGSNRCPPSLHFRLCMTRSQTCQTRPEAASHGHGYFWVMAVIVSSLFYHCVTWLLLDNTRCFPRSKFFLYFFTPVIFYQGVSIETTYTKIFL